MPKIGEIVELPLDQVDWRGRQMQLLERVPCVKALAAAVQKDPSTLYRCLRGEHPIPTHVAWDIVHVLSDLWFLQGYASRYGLLIIQMPRPGQERLETLTLLGNLSGDLSSLIKLACEIERGAVIPEEVINETVDKIQAAVELVRLNLLEENAKNAEREQ